MLGIEKLKEAAKAVVDFGEKIEEALKDDGKLTFVEGITIAVGSAPEIFSMVKDAGEIKDEFLDLDDIEREELSDFVASELDLNADGLEIVVEAGFELLVSLEGLVSAIKDAKEVEE
jgi:hypothetical protein